MIRLIPVLLLAAFCAAADTAYDDPPIYDAPYEDPSYTDAGYDATYDSPSDYGSAYGHHDTCHKVLDSV